MGLYGDKDTSHLDLHSANLENKLSIEVFVMKDNKIVLLLMGIIVTSMPTSLVKSSCKEMASLGEEMKPTA